MLFRKKKKWSLDRIENQVERNEIAVANENQTNVQAKTRGHTTFLYRPIKFKIYPQYSEISKENILHSTYTEV